MTTKTAGPNAVITAPDFDRLMNIIESPRYRSADPRRVLELRSELDRRVIVAPTRTPRGAVTMNSRVRVRDLAVGGSQTYTLVYPEAADIEVNRLSVLAPLGTALLGRFAGDVVEFDVPAGVRRMRVERVVYQPEAAGDFHL